jgi:hypothetical protein
MLGAKAMVFLFAVIALLAVSALAIMAGSSGNTHKPQNQHQPNSQDSPANPNATDDHEQKANDGAEVHETQNYGERFVRFVERREKFITAASTIFIAAFTIILGVSTAFLYNATRNLVSGAEETAERQLRAYVFVENVEMITEGRIVRAVLSIKNFGRTPAYDLVIYVGMSSRGFGDVFVPPEPDEIKLDKLSIGPAMSISASNQFEVPAGNNDLLPGLDRGEAVVYVYGRIDYIDAFKIPRYLIYRQRASKLTNGSWHLAATPEGNTGN